MWLQADDDALIRRPPAETQAPVPAPTRAYPIPVDLVSGTREAPVAAFRAASRERSAGAGIAAGLFSAGSYY
jgi:hypothetical protein